MADTTTIGSLLWTPSDSLRENSHMQAFMKAYPEPVSDYHELWDKSVQHPAQFWQQVWDYFQIHSHTPYQSVLAQIEGGVYGAKWFEGATLNYAEHIFRQENEAHPALIWSSERHPHTEMAWEDLREAVSKVRGYLKESGVVAGDRVVSYLPNTPHALIAFLATNSLGAVWSSCSPDFGTASVIDRFQQIEPKVLFAIDGYSYNGKIYERKEEVRSLKNALSSLEKVVWVPYVGMEEDAPAGLADATWTDLMFRDAELLTFEPVPFDHPMWVLYSSGTTGAPKAITHSVGGVLLEHYKAIGLHQNVKKGDRFFWYSTTGWMMWNYANSALLLGGTVVIHDGAAGYPELGSLWQLARDVKINHFGGGAAYYIACMKAGMEVGKEGDLPDLQSIGSTGSPLPPEAYRWIYEAVKKDVWLVSLSGGTDVCSGFVGGSPTLPVFEGEIQCRMLGCSVEAYDESGKPVEGEVGEMVISQPMPSMPIYFWNDKGDARYRKSYFEMYPGVWRHGDWIRISDEGTLVIYGRSDATLNRGGVRIGTSEVYRAVDSLSEIKDSLVVSLERKDGSYYMPLFVVLEAEQVLDEALKKAVKTALRTQFSPRHVPDEIIEVPEIPYTISGKKMETPVKKILMGIPPEKAVSQDAMKNPAAITFFIAMGLNGGN